MKNSQHPLHSNKFNNVNAIMKQQHETLRDKREANAKMNNFQLNQAKNLKELVNIDVQAIDPKLEMDNFRNSCGGGELPAMEQDYFKNGGPMLGEQQHELFNQNFGSQRLKSAHLYQGPRNHGAAGYKSEIQKSLHFSGQSTAKYTSQTHLNQKTAGFGHFDKVGRNAHGTNTAFDQVTKADTQLIANDDDFSDPIKSLNGIFQPKQPSKRAPVHPNFVMNKYKQRNHTACNMRSMRSKRNNKTRLSQDMNLNVQSELNDALSMSNLLQNSMNKEQTQQIHIDQLEMPDQVFSYQVASQSDRNQDYNEQPKPTGNVKTKLKEVQKLFEEEDMKDRIDHVQSQWMSQEPELQNQKMNMNLRFRMEEPVEDLRGYMVKQIEEMKQRSNPLRLDQEIAEKEKELPQDYLPDSEQDKFNFKASTLSHIAEVRPIGQMNIEQQFNDRLYRQQTNYAYDKYMQASKKEAKLQAVVSKRNSRNKQHVRSYSSYVSGQNGAQSRFKKQNVIQEQNQKIDRINRMADQQKALQKRQAKQEKEAEKLRLQMLEAQKHQERLQLQLQIQQQNQVVTQLVVGELMAQPPNKKQTEIIQVPTKVLASKPSMEVMNTQAESKNNVITSKVKNPMNDNDNGIGSSPSNENLHSDTDYQYMSTCRNPKERTSPTIKGGGFRDLKPISQELNSPTNAEAATGFCKGDLKKKDNEQPGEVVHGSHFSYFCPKRFNRYPRFTICFKKDQVRAEEANNTVALTPQFLSYLMENKQENAEVAQSQIPLQQQQNDFRDSQLEQPSVEHQSALYNISQLDPKNMDLHAHKEQQNYQPPKQDEAVTSWNLPNQDQVQNFDPFQQVVLYQGIDNQILTSLRTLKKENNTVSDTFKIVHQKFLPTREKGQCLQQMQKTQNLKVRPAQFYENDYMQSGQEEQGDQDTINQQNDDYQYLYLDSNQAPTLVPQKEVEAPVTTVFPKKQINLFQNQAQKQEQPLQSVNDMLLEQILHKEDQEEQQKSQFKSEFEKTAGALVKQKPPVGNRKFKKDKKENNLKHQIEVMVLSKVDPIDSAFPGSFIASESNQAQNPLSALSGRVVEAKYHQPVIEKKTKNRTKVLTSKTKNEKGVGSNDYQQRPGKKHIEQCTQNVQESPSLMKGGAEILSTFQSHQSNSAYKNINNQGNQNSNTLQNSSKGHVTGANANSTINSVLPHERYGKDFKVPELPQVLQDQFFGNAEAENMIAAQPTQWFTSASGAGSAQYKIKKFIDDIYQKEMKYRYHRQYVKEDYLLVKSPIFDLSKSHALKQKGDLFRKSQSTGGMRQLQANQSLSDVLGFQAGGPNVIMPLRPTPVESGPISPHTGPYPMSLVEESSSMLS